MSLDRLAVLLSLVVVVMMAAPVHGQERKGAPQSTVEAAAEVQLVGQLTRQYRGRCGADGQHKWDDEHWEVGFVRLEVPDGMKLGKLEGQAVVVTGKPTAAKPAPAPEYVHAAVALNPKPDGPGIECPMYQMRSDWVIGKNGMRIMRGRSAGLPALLKVEKARPFDGLDLEVHGPDLSVTFTNTFKSTLKGVKLKLHYEGCYGKPGTDTRTESLGDLAAGDNRTLLFPTIVDEDQGKWGIRHHRAYSIQVLSSSGDVLFDCDLSMASFSVTGIECPAEK